MTDDVSKANVPADCGCQAKGTKEMGRAGVVTVAEQRIVECMC